MTKYAVYQYGYAVWGTGATEEDAILFIPFTQTLLYKRVISVK